jgi:hypothetical protein
MARSRFPMLIFAAIVAAACTAQPPATADEASVSEGAAPAMSAAPEPDAAKTEHALPAARAATPATERSTDPAAVRGPEVREITIPAGTALSLELATTVSSQDSSIEDPVQATLRRAIVVDGATVVPAGAQVSGHVTEATRPGRVKGLARVGMRFNRLRVGNTAYDIRTAAISRQGEATKKDDATKIGIGAGAGAITGAIAGGKKGAAIGTAVGAGGGTAVVLATRGEDVTVARGTVVTARLAQPVTIRIH